jgi:hypothetical protein
MTTKTSAAKKLLVPIAEKKKLLAPRMQQSLKLQTPKAMTKLKKLPEPILLENTHGKIFQTP